MVQGEEKEVVWNKYSTKYNKSMNRWKKRKKERRRNLLALCCCLQKHTLSDTLFLPNPPCTRNVVWTVKAMNSWGLGEEEGRKGGSGVFDPGYAPDYQKCASVPAVFRKHQKNIFNITEIFSRKHIRTCDNPPVNHQLCLHGQPKLKVPNYFIERNTR